MATYSLEDLKAEVEKKYEPTVVTNGDEKFVMPNLLQLDSGARDKILAMVDGIGEDDELSKQVDTFSEIIKLAVSDGKGEQLLELFGHNTAMIFEFVSDWMGDTQLGEAERS